LPVAPFIFREKQMSWLSVRAAAWAFLLCNFGLVSSAMAARLPTSALIVHVLSVDQESFNRSPAMLKDGKPFGDQWYETTGFIAKAQIQNVIRTDHGLTPGQTITIRYKIQDRHSATDTTQEQVTESR
jgi:hypothetical protein